MSFGFNTPCQFTLLNLHPVMFGVTLWLAVHYNTAESVSNAQHRTLPSVYQTHSTEQGWKAQYTLYLTRSQSTCHSVLTDIWYVYLPLSVLCLIK